MIRLEMTFCKKSQTLTEGISEMMEIKLCVWQRALSASTILKK